MPFVSSIKFKLQLLLLLSITLALALVGAALSYFIEQYHLNASQQRFSRAFSIVTEEMELRESQLKTVAAGLAQRDDVISSVNMIYQYSSPKDYQPLIFDAEKRRLQQTLHNQSNVTGIGQLAIYDGRGMLLAFYSAAGQGSSGYTSYERGNMVVYRRDGDGERQEGGISH